MNQVRITALKQAVHQDLINQYEQIIEHPCCIEIGQTFVSKAGERPNGFCESAWQNISMYVFALAYGAEDFYVNWMKNKKSAMIACNDGFRPISFLLEVIE